MSEQDTHGGIYLATTKDQAVNRNQALDILRGIAILLVLGFHYSYFHWWWQIGWTGVDLFFVLSGFLISGLLFEEHQKTGRIALVRFWIRRGFKIYPPYYLLVLVTTVSFLATRHDVPTRIFSAVFFVQNYFPHIWPHTWSLAVEEHFYFLLPLLLIALIRRKSLHAVPWIFAATAVTCLALRFAEFNLGEGASAIHSATHLRIDSLFCGVAIRWWKEFRPQSFSAAASRSLWLGALLLVPALLLPPSGEFMSTIGLTFLYLGYGLILTWAVGRPRSDSPLATSLAWIGRHSYSIYLWHLPLWAVLYRGRMTFGFFFLGSTLSILFGAVISKLIEVPSLQIRDKLFPNFSKGYRNLRDARPTDQLAATLTSQ